jgi:hypothetical protein
MVGYLVAIAYGNRPALHTVPYDIIAKRMWRHDNRQPATHGFHSSETEAFNQRRHDKHVGRRIDRGEVKSCLRRQVPHLCKAPPGRVRADDTPDQEQFTVWDCGLTEAVNQVGQPLALGDLADKQNPEAPVTAIYPSLEAFWTEEVSVNTKRYGEKLGGIDAHRRKGRDMER